MGAKVERLREERIKPGTEQEVELESKDYVIFFKGRKKEWKESRTVDHYGYRTDYFENWSGEGEITVKDSNQAFVFNFSTHPRNRISPSSTWHASLEDAILSFYYDFYWEGGWPPRGPKPVIVDEEAKQKIIEMQVIKITEEVKKHYQIPPEQRTSLVASIKIKPFKVMDLVERGIVFGPDGQRHLPTGDKNEQQ